MLKIAHLVIKSFCACLIIALMFSYSKTNAQSIQNVLLNKIANNDSLPFGKILLTASRKQDSAYTFSTSLLSEVDSFKRKTFSYQYCLLSNDPNKSYLTKSQDLYVLYVFKGSRVYMIFDTDNDSSFTDEKMYDPDTCTKFIRLDNLPYYYSKSAKNSSLFIRPCLNIFGSAELNNKYALDMLPVYKKGSFKLGDSSFYFFVFNLSYDKYTKKNTSLSISLSSSPFQHYDNIVKYRVGDSIYLGRKMFLIAGTDEYGDTLKLQNAGTQNLNYGVDVNSYAFNMTGKDIMTGKTYTIGQSRKYTLLDFWGTWCKPCKALTPALKELRERLPDSTFDMVSIAFDESINKVKQYLKEEHIKWVNFFDDEKKSLFASKFTVREFPTLILLDGKGKIIFRGSGTDSFKKMEGLLPK